MPMVVFTISTSILLDPEFVDNPRLFAGIRGITVEDEFMAETTFRRNDERPNDVKEERERAQIHLLRPNAIRLKVSGSGKSFRINTIRVDPSLLIYGVECHPLVEGDLARSLSVLHSIIQPLLANPEDGCHIVPGIATGEPIARWQSFQFRTLLPRVDIRTLHHLSHPMTGPAEGADHRQIRLKRVSEHLEILFEKAVWQVNEGRRHHKVDGHVPLYARTITS
jgi:hypothetical protein